jgi:DNA repair protein RadA/Sms
VLYATGEESLKQVALRARRLGLEAATARLIAETCVEDIVGAAASLKARVLIVDSIQTMHSERIESRAGRGIAAARVHGGAGALREVQRHGGAARRSRHQGRTDRGTPRVLEHMVDTVLYFESDTGSRYRVLRSVKNRFGAANEIGVFAMVEQGSARGEQPVGNFPVASRRAGSGQRHHRDARGHALAADRSAGAGGCSLGANPRRVAVGIDGNRLTMLLAVAHRHGGIAAARMCLPMWSAACAWRRRREIWRS